MAVRMSCDLPLLLFLKKSRMPSFLTLAVVAVVACAAVAPAVAALSPPVEWSAVLTPNPPATDFYSYGDPIAANGIIFQVATTTSNNASKVFAVNQFTGSLLWSVSLNKISLNNVAFTGGMYAATGDGLVFVGTDQGLVGMSQTSGALAFTVAAPAAHKAIGGWPGKPSFSRGLVLCAWYNTPMVAVNASTGDVVYTTPYIVGGHVWINGDAFTTTQVDAATGVYSLMHAAVATGAVKWTRKYNTVFTTQASNQYAIAVKHADAAGVHYLDSVDPATGSLRFSVAMPSPVWDYNVADDAIYQVLDVNGSATLKRYDPVHGLQWSTATAVGANFNCVSFGTTVFVDDVALGRTIAYDGVTGALLWTYAAAAPAYGVVSGNTYYVAVENSRVAALTIRW
jgi:outer membrane protein assembly factor BamB